jgi:hypothetical protein
MSYPVGAAAVAGVSIGGKIGYTEYRGDILPGSGDLGSGAGYALILGFGTIPTVDFQLRASYFAKDFEYTYDLGGGNVWSSSFEYRDVGVTALLMKDILSAPGAPFAFYIGGGVGYHVINTEAAMAFAAGSLTLDDADNPLTLVENTGKMSGEGVIGLRLGAPAFPVRAFGEISYGVIFTAERLSQLQYSAGLVIGF